MDKTELFDRYTVHRMTYTQQNHSDNIRNEVQKLAALINENVTDCREKSLALTKLEEVLFFANAGIARH